VEWSGRSVIWENILTSSWRKDKSQYEPYERSPFFWDETTRHWVFGPRNVHEWRAPITRWCSVTTQMNGDLSCAVKKALKYANIEHSLSRSGLASQTAQQERNTLWPVFGVSSINGGCCFVICRMVKGSLRQKYGFHVTFLSIEYLGNKICYSRPNGC
jgi:hypothetical protein